MGEEQKPAVAVLDIDEWHLYGRGEDGRINYGYELLWPQWWPRQVTDEWLRKHGIRVEHA